MASYFTASLTLVLCCILLLQAEHIDAACGYKACPAEKKNLVNVHLVPHSHDDVGWLKTVDQYYYGSRNNIQHAGVQYILDSVVQELLKDSKRRFIYVESEFFFRWYNEQTSALKKDVTKLIQDGRLEFAGGAWSMNDEAAVHYQSVIDQFSIGLKALNDAFGVCARPRIGWQIDPFGHSREMASIFAQMGYDGEFFARMDWVEKNERLLNMTAEMIWKASDNLGTSAEIFTGLLYHHYSAPPGFCFDNLCGDLPIIDGKSYDHNVEQRVNAFLDHINKMSKYYRGSHIMVPMGDDFNYENAAMNFKNMDKLIKYVNERQTMGSKINVFYSTPACYLNALHEDNLTWPNKTQDFFPYSTDWHTYWTGYYTSRPTQKRFERDGNHFLQVAKQLTTLANFTTAAHTQNLDQLRHVMGIMQHHDAITGTEKQHVAYDYDRLLSAAIDGAHLNTRDALQKITNLTRGEFQSCLLHNISVCEFSNKTADNLVVTLYNPLAQPSRQIVRIPIKNEMYSVSDQSGRMVASEMVPVPREVLALPFRSNGTTHELVFQATVDKVASYYIRKRARAANEVSDTLLRANKLITPLTPRAVGDVVVQNSGVKLTFNSQGFLTEVQMNGISESIRQDFYYYRSAYGNNAEFKNRSSGAYIFRPNGTEIIATQRVELSIHQNSLVKEVHQKFNNWISQVVRIYEGVNRVEFEWLIGPIPIGDNIGKEIITRFSSNLRNDGVFWTDSNGREMLQRVRNEREYFKANLTERISGNYYPITTRIALQNQQRRIALLTDRAQGGSSVKDGSLELMLHRRMLRDDAFGVGEALNETAYGQGLVARGKVYLMLSQLNFKPTLDERNAQLQLHLPFWKFYSNASMATNKVLPRIPSFAALPNMIHMLTLEPYSNNERLLRLEHFMDRNETGSVTFNLQSIFTSLNGQNIRETTLDGSMPLSDMKRFKFQPDGSKTNKVEFYTSKHTPLSAKKGDAASKFQVTFEPMQMRTFIIKWA